MTSRGSFFDTLERRRIVIDPVELLSTGAFRALDLEAVGIFFRLAPYMVAVTSKRDWLHRLAGVSRRKFDRYWPQMADLFTEVQPGEFLLAESDAISVQAVSISRPALRGLFDALVAFWGSACVYCGDATERLQIEHIVPRARGGSDELDNLTLACKRCNLKKRTQTAAEFGYPQIHEQAKRIQ